MKEDLSDIDIIESFYRSFQNLDAKGMNDFYHENATFSDPVFHHLNSLEVKKMWAMLIERSDGKLDIQFSNIRSVGNKILAHWEAKYEFSRSKRKVHNKIDSEFVLQNGKIINQIDSFNFWKWASMALGPIGTLLGWTTYLKNKVRKQSRRILKKYMNQKA